jgi:sugar O-acyltransferase (sialic acid O-acetyltransferase NeuD family)
MKIVFLGANNPETLRDISAQKNVAPHFEVIGFLDNDKNKIGKDFHGYKVLGELRMAAQLVDLNTVSFLNLITRDCQTRLITSLEVTKIGGNFTNLVHPSVNLEQVKVGIGIYIQENVILQAGVMIGNNCAINAGSIVSHEVKLGNSVFLAPGCRLAGCIEVEDGVFFGVGATVMPRIKIGKWSIIGAGSVVIRDVPPYSVMAGNPAKVIKKNETELDSGNILL